jgi:hypothetical protein
MVFYELTADDIGKTRLDAFGRNWSLNDVLDKVRPDDVGKRVYKVANNAQDGYEFLQIESTEQRDARLADPLKNAKDNLVRELEALNALKARHNAEMSEASARLGAAYQAVRDAVDHGANQEHG